MANVKITDLTSQTGAGSASADLAVVVDVSDTSMAASGTDKKITLAELGIALGTVGGLATDTEVATAVSDHAAATDPHGDRAFTTSALGSYLTSSAAPELIRDTIGAALTAGSGITITPNDGADTITIAATAGATPARDVPLSLDGGTTRHGSIPGVVMVKDMTASVTYGGASSTAIQYFPIFVTEQVTFDAMHINVWSGGVGANVRLGLYNANTYWMPTSLVVDAGATSAASTGLKTLAVSSTVLAPGRYLMAMQPDGTAGFNPLMIWGSMMGAWGLGLDANSFVIGLKTGNTTYAALAATAYTTGLTKQLSGSVGYAYPVWLRAV